MGDRVGQDERAERAGRPDLGGLGSLRTLFLIAGAGGSAFVPFFALLLRDRGLTPQSIGLVFAVTSLVGAVAGSVIDPRRESLEDIERLKQSMGELFFSAQYQQEPIPLAGNLIKAAWFKDYDAAPTADHNDLLVISIDTAMKGTPSADYSVATVWLACGETIYLIDVWRDRVDYPNLKRAVGRLKDKYPTAVVLIEDKGSGTSLIQDLRSENKAPIAINPDGDKITRLAAVSVQFESGAVWFPKSAPWLSSLKAELLGFPNVKHDDQVDSISQALSWLKKHRQNRISFVPPIIIYKPRGSYFDAINSR